MQLFTNCFGGTGVIGRNAAFFAVYVGKFEFGIFLSRDAMLAPYMP